MQPLDSTGLRRWMVPFAAGMVMTGVIGVLLYWNSASARTSDQPGFNPPVVRCRWRPQRRHDAADRPRG